MNTKFNILIIITVIITTGLVMVIPPMFYFIACLLSALYIIFEYKEKSSNIEIKNVEYIVSIVAISILIFGKSSVKFGIIPFLSLIIIRIILENLNINVEPKGTLNNNSNNNDINLNDIHDADYNEISDKTNNSDYVHNINDETEIIKIGENSVTLSELISNNNFRILFDKKISLEKKRLKLIYKRINRSVNDISDIYKYIKNLDDKNSAELEKINCDIKDIQDELEYIDTDSMKTLTEKIGKVSKLNNLYDKEDEIKACVFKIMNISSEINILYMNSENIIQNLEYIKSDVYGQKINIEPENKAYFEFVKEIVERLDNTMTIISKEIKDNNTQNKLSIKKYESYIDDTNKSMNALIDSFSSNLEKINERLSDTPENILKELKYFDVNISKNIDKAINAVQINIDKMRDVNAKNDITSLLEDYLNKNSILDKRLELIEKFVDGINVPDVEISSIKKYKGRLSDRGYEYVSLAEYLYSLLGKNSNNEISDYSPVYIMYSKFLEYELALIIGIDGDGNTSMNSLLANLKGYKQWYYFVEDFNKRGIRQLRNKAAHAGSIEVTITNVMEMRKFLFDKNPYKNISWIEYIAKNNKI